MSEEMSALALEAMTGFLVETQWLKAWALEAGLVLVHLVPKHHFCLHLAEEARFLNPRFTWTYRTEHFVGKMSNLAMSVSHGVRSTRLSLFCFSKYRFYLHLVLTMFLQEDL